MALGLLHEQVAQRDIDDAVLSASKLTFIFPPGLATYWECHELHLDGALWQLSRHAYQHVLIDSLIFGGNSNAYRKA